MQATTSACPCGTGFPFAACCAPYLAGIAPAPTAETLMRSRYSAYVLERSDYIRSTWHPATCPNALNPEPGLHWLGLKIKRVEDGLEQDDHGIVEFVARSKRDGRAQRLHETSIFERIDGNWVYVRGEAC
jgi:SEC-C motif domain protein